MIELPRGRISGRTLRTLVQAVRRTPARHLASKLLRRDLGIDELRALPPDARGAISPDVRPVRARDDHARGSKSLGNPQTDRWPRSVAAIAAAYRDGKATPSEVVERSLSAARELAARRPPVRAIHELDEKRALRDATEAGERIAGGRARGPLDGVPVAIKEEIDVEGLPTRVGTGWMPAVAAASDSAAVARLRAAGAVIVGLTPMTEYGLSPLGGNVHRDMPRNAHSAAHLAGGSSTGSAVAVATGLVPVALGADGGGSIRTPAAFNGVFGLKPTFGLVPTTGHGLPVGSSVVHLGPIGASPYDLAVFCEAARGEDPGDPSSLGQPKRQEGDLVHALGRGVEGLRIGVVERDWRDADSRVATTCRDALKALEAEGATLVDIDIALAPHAPAIGYLTIGLESFTGLGDVRKHHIDELGLDNQLLLSGLSTFEADDYLDAQRLRTELRRQTADALQEVDLIAHPTNAAPAPPVTDDEAVNGFVDPEALGSACRFAFLGNLTGLPAGTAPVGRVDGLPVGVQLLADAWDEATVLQTLAHLERGGAAQVERPATHVDLLERA